MNQLRSLKKITTVVADTGDIKFIKKYQPKDATTNPTLILRAINLHAYQHLIISALKYAKLKGGNYQKKVVNASEKISVLIGAEILKYIPGKISTEIDARLSFNKDQCIEKAHSIIRMYEEEGIERSKILIKVAATWECICAAKELKKDNINCNLTLLFSFAQARACAEAEVFLISPFVGRIYDWYQSKFPTKTYLVENDPGVKSVKKIYKYYKENNYKTIVMGASFRRIEQILALAGCDCLTISPELLKELEIKPGNVEQILKDEKKYCKDSSILSESEFRWDHNEDPMAVEKLSEGIRKFSEDQEKLEKTFSKKF
ncbi:transaldolase [Buchnera aphidicola (Mindarus keteleerifoliae)]|uniref:transaldolase n=1 Tax=Buchnera aphidicola TaxID=9 RepID=UPI0031B71919